MTTLEAVTGFQVVCKGCGRVIGGEVIEVEPPINRAVLRRCRCGRVELEIRYRDCDHAMLRERHPDWVEAVGVIDAGGNVA